MALTLEQSIDRVADYLVRPQLPIAGGADPIIESAMCHATAAGYIVKVGDSGGAGVGPVLGCAEFTADNSTGTDGERSLWLQQGMFWRKLSQTNPPTQAYAAGAKVYAEDDETVSTDSSLPVAGTCWYIEPAGVGEERGALILIGAENAALATLLVKLIDVTIDHEDLTASGLTETVDLDPLLPPSAIPLICRSKLVEPFDHGTAATATLKVGNDGDDDAYDGGADIFTGSAFTGLVWFRGAPGAGIGAPAYNGTATGQAQALFTIDAGNIADFTAGTVRVQVWGYALA